MIATPYLFFPMTCDAAMTFYAKVLGCPQPQFFRFEDMPQEEQDKMPGVPPKAVMNCALEFEGGMIMASDDSTLDGPSMSACDIHLELPDAAAARRVFDALAEGGTISMPMTPTFWTEAFGSLKDKFGTRWMISAPST